MINMETILNVSDNSGAKEIKCIKVCRFKKNSASEGALLRISVKSFRSSRRANTRVKKGEVCMALLIGTKVLKFYTITSSHSLGFKKNFAILLSKQYKLLGTRILNPFSTFFRQTKFLKLTFIAPGLIK